VNNRERLVIACALAVTFALVGIDLFNDFGEGVAGWHVALEAGAALSALSGLFFLLRGAVTLKRRLGEEIARSSAYRDEAEAWRSQARQYLAGLAAAIDQQLTRWKLTVAEKDVAFLLLKGYGLKEIAQLRNTAEKTTRAQSTSIYAKAGLSGRSELAAFFLEDLLVPGQEKSLP
jgi:DNA-binding CsgD family transcriptional regulator